MLFSFDKLVNLFMLSRKTPQGAELVRSRLYSVENPKGLYILIPPWHEEHDYYTITRKKILKRGYSCVEYLFSPDMLSDDPEKTKTSFEKVKHHLITDIQKLVNIFSFKEIHIIGTSIGCVEALMVANNNPLISNVILVAPGNCLAESMWKGIRTRRLRKSMERKGITLEFLKNEWRGLAPENNIDGLEGKEITVYLSKSDLIIPYELGLQLVEKMKAHDLTPLVKENFALGHYLTVISYYLNPTI